MKLRIIGAGAILAVSLTLEACGGGGHASGVTPTSGTAKTSRKPDTMTSFTIRYPTNLIHGVKKGIAARKRAPKFIDPGGNGYTPIIVVRANGSDGATYSSCASAAPAADGTQTIPVGLFSSGGSISVNEYQSGSLVDCSNNGVTLASPQYGYGYGPFTPGTDQSSPITTLQLYGVVANVLYSTDQSTWYIANRYGGGDDIQVCNAGATVYFAGADADGVGAGTTVVTATPDPNATPTAIPSGGPTTAPTAMPTGANTLTGDFPPPSFTQIAVSSSIGSTAPVFSAGPVAASINVQPNLEDSDSAVTFTVTASDTLTFDDNFSFQERISDDECGS